MIAILGDIHGNIEILKVAYEAAVAHKVERIYHLGDLGGYAPFVNEVVDFLIEHEIEGVQGNYDDAVAHSKAHCGCKYESLLQEKMAALAFEQAIISARLFLKEKCQVALAGKANSSLESGNNEILIKL